MDKNYEKLFSHLTSSELPDGLFLKTVKRIETEKRQLARHHRLVAIFSLLGLIISIIAFIPSIIFVWSEFSSSSFMEFFSLLFSDSKVVMAYWQIFAKALLESLPFMGLVILLAVVVAFFESLKFLLRDIKFIFKFNQ